MYALPLVIGRCKEFWGDNLLLLLMGFWDILEHRGQKLNHLDHTLNMGQGLKLDKTLCISGQVHHY